MNKIGIVLNSLGPAQLPFSLITSGNEFVKSETRSDLVLFYYDLTPECVRPLFGVMNLAEAFNYNGTLIATNINSASRILEYPGTTKKYFYVWDLEWIRSANRQYEQFLTVYKNPKLPLIARSKRHADILENNFNNKPIGIADANVGELSKIISEYEAKQ